MRLPYSSNFGLSTLAVAVYATWCFLHSNTIINNCKRFKFSDFANIGGPDQFKWNKTHLCITHKNVELCRLKTADGKIETTLHKFIDTHPQIVCKKSLLVGRGDVVGGQHPYNLCEDFLPDPNNCIVYSFGLVNFFSYNSLTERYLNSPTKH